MYKMCCMWRGPGVWISAWKRHSLLGETQGNPCKGNAISFPQRLNIVEIYFIDWKSGACMRENEKKRIKKAQVLASPLVQAPLPFLWEGNNGESSALVQKPERKINATSAVSCIFPQGEVFYPLARKELRVAISFTSVLSFCPHTIWMELFSLL